jgi:hypothetical protein
MVDEDRRTVLEAAPADAEVVVPAANSGNTDPLVIRMPVDIRSAALTVIAGIALVLFLQYAQAVLIPVVLGTLIFYALDPIVDRAQKLRVPRMIGAAVVLLAVFGGTGYGVWTLRDDVLAVVEELPGAARRVRATLASERRRERSTSCRRRRKRSTGPRRPRRVPSRATLVASSGCRSSNRFARATT